MRHRTFSKIFLLLALLFIMPQIVSAQASDEVIPTEEINVYFFWGEGCPHCEAQMPFMKMLDSKYPNLNIHYLETWHNKTNAELFVSMAKAYGVKATGVPATFIGDKTPIIGYDDSETTGKIIENRIIECLPAGCINPIDKLEGGSVAPINDSVDIPVLGNIDAGSVSLPVMTIILAGLDSFNPCAFFVLLFLLSMLVYAGSRKRMLLVGGVFIFFSALIYFLFMAAWLNVFLWTGEILLMTLIAGALAFIIGIINVKDFFFFKKGISLSIPDKAKPKLFERMRSLIKESSIGSILLGTVVLAIVANSYELLCTAGFPMVFTRILTLNNLPTATYYSYLILYNLVYIIPMAIIVGVFTYTLGSRKLQESEGRALKLISGMMMLMLGFVLLIKPSLLNNVFMSLIMIVLAVGLSLILIKFRSKKD